jgi:hypothetical protein
MSVYYVCNGSITYQSVNAKAVYGECSVNWIVTNVAPVVQQAQPTLQDIFSIPVAPDLLKAWELGFGLPILCYMTAWAFGSLINFFDPKHDN